MRYGPMGVSKRATIGEMLAQPSASAAQQPRMPMPPRRVLGDTINTTVDFRPSPRLIKNRDRMR